MYAVIRTGGKQYRVAKNDVILVERLPGDTGAVVSFDEVLMVGEGQTGNIGYPLVSGASVSATILEQKRSDKVIVFKKKRRKNYRRKAGHRQNLTVLRITDIMAKDKEESGPSRVAEKPNTVTGKGTKAKTTAKAKKTVTKNPSTKKKVASPKTKGGETKKSRGVKDDGT